MMALALAAANSALPMVTSTCVVGFKVADAPVWGLMVRAACTSAPVRCAPFTFALTMFAASSETGCDCSTASCSSV